MTINSNSVFIHSLFRSGSTYVFNVFRRSGLNYYCYQEPLNEYLLNAGSESSKLLDNTDELQEYLRHPALEKSYFYEFFQVADKVAMNFCKEFSYDQYFTKEQKEINALSRYFSVLEKGAEGRAFFQCCRTSGRIDGLRSELGGKHFYLWRNSWDQWWSYRKGFDTNSLLIINANNLPRFLSVLKEKLNIPNFHNKDTSEEYDFFRNHKLNFSSSYKIFYGLWCHAFLDAKLYCDLFISIDKLSSSNDYRDEILGALNKRGVGGLDFSDCSVPRAVYAEGDRDFFLPIEDYIHSLLLSHGYSDEQVDELKKMSNEKKDKVVDASSPKNFLIRDARRAREYLEQANSEIVDTQNLLINAEAKAEQAEAKAEQAEAKAEQAEAKAEQAEAKAEQAEAKAEQAETNVEQAEAKDEKNIGCSETIHRKKQKINPMRIVIDLQSAQTDSRFRGIGRYSTSLTKAIIRNCGDHEVIIALSGLFPDVIEPIRAEFGEFLPQENIRIWYAPGPVKECERGNHWRHEAAELTREAFLASLNPDVIYIASLFGGYSDEAVVSIGLLDKVTPVFTSLYDLIPLLNPELYLKPCPTYEQYYLREIDFLKRTSGLLAISNFSRQEGVDNLDYNASSIINVSAAIDSCFKVIELNSSQTQLCLESFKITSEFILYTGGSDYRKNLPRLINAYAQLPVTIRKMYQLVFVGKMPEVDLQNLKQHAAQAGVKKSELIFTGYITDDELVKLYNLCKLYVFPSWHEGFGLPALEAMSCGAAVIGANATSLPEVIGNKNALFDPFSEEAIAHKITEVLTDERFRLCLIKSGLKQAKKFSWGKSAKIAIKAFEHALNDQTVALESGEFMPKEQVRVNVIGYISGNLGLSVSARGVIEALLENGINVSIVDIDPGLGRGGHDNRYKFLNQDPSNPLSEGINLFIVPPPGIESFQVSYPNLFEGNNFLVAFSMWELPVLPKGWCDILNQMDALVAGSEFIRHAFSFNVPATQSLVTNHPVYIPENIIPMRDELGLNFDDVVFFTAFEPYSDVVRKNIDGVVSSFLSFLGDESNAILIIKVNNAFLNNEPHPAYKEIIEAVNNHPRVKFLTNNLPYEQLMSLYASCDVIVSLHRAEGLGLVMMEAMMLGKPVIATAWSGNMSYMDHTNSCLVGYDLIDANGAMPCYQKDNIGEGAVWANPNLKEAGLWMQRLYKDSRLRKRIGQKALQDITKYQKEARESRFVDELLVMYEMKRLNQGGGVSNKAVMASLGGNTYQCWLDRQQENSLIQSAEFLLDKDQDTKIHCLIYIDSDDLSLLANTIDSFAAQTYSNWHLSVVSPSACPDKIFNEIMELSWIQLEGSESLGALLSEIAVESEWLLFLEAGDSIESYAFSSCVQYIDQNDSWDIIYTDDDKLSEEGFYYSPNFKPNFNLDLLYSLDYIGGLCLFKLSALTGLGNINYPNPFVGYDLVLNYIECCSELAIGHIERILLHRADAVDAFLVEHLEFRELTLAHHFKRKNITASISKNSINGVLDVKYPHTDTSKVSIIIPTKDQLPILKACVDSILETTSYPDYEIIIIDNQSEESETKDYFNEITTNNKKIVKVIAYNKTYNYSAINNFAVEQAKGDYLVLLNNDTMVLQEEWLQGMLSHLQREEVGIVGVKLVYTNKTVQHAGIMLGMGGNGVADHPHIGIPMDAAGYMNRAVVTQNVSAVTAACLMIEKSLYQQVGGLDEEKFRILYNDVDLCLKVRELGKKIVWTPYVSLIHHGSSSLKKRKQNKKRLEQAQQEVDNMLEKWLPQLANDSAYNRNLSLKTTDFQLDTAMNVTWNVDVKGKLRVYAFPMDSFGVGQYRVRAPVNALTKANVIESGLANNVDNLIYPTPVEIERINPDVLLGQNLFLENMLVRWKRYKKFNDVFMVAGLDDVVYTLPSHHPRKGVWSENIRKNVKEFFQYSDRVVVANSALADEFKKLTSNEIIIVPNYLENWRWQSLDLSKKKVGNKMRVGWAGGQEHITDLQFILPIVETLHKEVDWIFMGLCLEEFKPYVKEVHGGVEFDLYPQKLADLNLDLAIAPLMHNKFNVCKTNLRLLEFGIMSWPIVCSDILPYQNAPVTRVANNTNEWIRVIREKINEPDELLKEGAELKRWVVDNYMLDDHIDEWATALLPS